MGRGGRGGHLVWIGLFQILPFKLRIRRSMDILKLTGSSPPTLPKPSGDRYVATVKISQLSDVYAGVVRDRNLDKVERQLDRRNAPRNKLLFLIATGDNQSCVTFLIVMLTARTSTS